MTKTSAPVIPLDRWLFGPADLATVKSAWNSLGAQVRASLLGLADEAVAHRFDLLGSGLVDLGNKIDWMRDFRSGHRWAADPIAKVPTVAGVPGSDIKVPWELSRFYHAPVLGAAYLLSNNESYAKEFTAQVDDWIRSNPVAHGPNWKCAMEACIRAANWLAALPFFAASPALDDSFRSRLAASLREHGIFTRANLEGTIHLRSNHYLADLQGLAYLAVLCPDIPEAGEWLDFSRRELEREVQWEVYPDGTDFEASVPYHRLCLELIAGPAALFRAYGVEMSADFWERLNRMFHAVRDLTDTSGRVPLIGDNDSGRLHVLARREDADLRYLLSLGSVLCRDPRLRLAGTTFSEEALLHCGPMGLAAWQAMPESAWPNTDTALPDSGWYVLRRRSGPAEDLVITCGPNGQRFRDPAPGTPRENGGHAHNDKLSVCYSVAGTQVLVDPGTACYTSDAIARNRSRSTAAHNCVQVETIEQQELRSDYLFNIHDAKAQPCVLTWGPDADLRFVGEHHGFVEAGGSIHRRTIETLTNAGFIVTDQFLPAANARPVRASWRFHLAPGLDATPCGHNAWHLGPATLVLPPWLPCQAEVVADLVCPAYGRSVPSRTLVITLGLKPPFTLAWNLIPARITAPTHVWGSLRPATIAGSIPPGRWEQPAQTVHSTTARELLQATLRRAEGLRGSTRAVAIRDGTLPSLLYARLDYWNSQAKAGGSLGHTAHVIEGFDHGGTRVASAMGLVPPLVDLQRCPLVLIKEPLQTWNVEHYEHQFFAAGEAQEDALRALALQHRAAAIYERIVIGSLAAARAAATLGIPHILEYNGSEIWVLRHWAKTPLHHEELFKAVETAALRSADLVVVVSEPLRQELLQRGIDDHRILVNPNAVDPVRFDPARWADAGRSLRARHGFGDQDVVLGFIGTFGAWHGIPVLAKALPEIMAISKRIRLLLIGDGNLRGEMEKAIQAGNYRDRVVITGIVAQDEAPAHLAACDIFLSPHQTPPDDTRPFFGSPTKLFEYLAMCRATIASDLGQIGEIITPAIRISDLEQADPATCAAVGVLTRPGDTTELVAAIRLLAERPALRERIARNGRERILTHHTWDIHVHRITERLMQLAPLTDAPADPATTAKALDTTTPAVEKIELPPFADWELQEAERKDALLVSKPTTYAYMLRSPELIAPDEDTWRLSVELEFDGEGAITFGALDSQGAWLSNVNLAGHSTARHSCVTTLTKGQGFRLVIANCRAKAAVTKIRLISITVEPLPKKRSSGDEAFKDEARRQWNTDHCGGDRGGVAETGSLDWFLNVERDRYENYAPWMKAAIGFERYAGKKVLEIGGGLGTDHAQFAKAGAICTDFDLAEGHLNMAKRNFAARGLKSEFILGDAETLDFPTGTFDVVYSFGVIHHTPGTEEVVKRIHRVLKPGGEAIIMVYARHSWNYWYKDWWKLYMRGGLRKTMTMADVLSANTEHSPNGARPLVKVYSARECRKLFQEFSTVKVEKYQLTAGEIPSWFLKILPLSLWGRLMGWNLLIRAVK